ncbi:MAG: hypothetical protein JEZ11_01545 [Desulfobacterales bacterium]|nr:hypothetical protein [Desulfobacterales bacterium]
MMGIKTWLTTVAMLAILLGTGPGASRTALAAADPTGPADRTETVLNAAAGNGHTAPDAGAKEAGVVIPPSDDRRITMNFFNVEVRELLSALAINQEINVVMSEGVAGRVSVHLNQVSLDRALDAITLAAGYGYRNRDEVYYIFKPKQDRNPQADWLQMRTFRLRYLDGTQVKEMLEAIPDVRLLEFHEPSRTLIVEDTPENIQRIETLIASWDVKPRQVMIEARILEVNLTDDMSLGVNWEQILGDVRLGSGGFSRGILPTVAAGISPVPLAGNAAGVFGNMITGAGTRSQFSAAIDALQAKTRVNTLASPRLLAVHGKDASVQVGGKQGYKVATSNMGVLTETIEFIDTGTILHITPFIDAENNILLNVRPTINAATLENGIPVVQSTVVSTWMIARSGETAFIGGLIRDTKTESREQIPILGSIPLLGNLFGRTVKGIGKSELVVLITPQIVDDDMARFSEPAEKAFDAIKKEIHTFPLPVDDAHRYESNP